MDLTIENMKNDTKEVSILKQNLGNNLWQLGKKLIEIKKNRFFLIKFPNFESYVIEELGLSMHSVTKFINFYDNFTETEIIEWGQKKLSLLIELDVKERAEVMKKVPSCVPLTKLKSVLNETKTPLKEASETDYKLFNRMDAVVLETMDQIEELKSSIFELKHLFESVQKLGTFQDYEDRSKITEHIEEIKISLGGLKL